MGIFDFITGVLVGVLLTRIIQDKNKTSNKQPSTIQYSNVKTVPPSKSKAPNPPPNQK